MPVMPCISKVATVSALIGVPRSISTVTRTFSTFAGSIRMSATRPTGMPR
jgi:hypothetical protein